MMDPILSMLGICRQAGKIQPGEEPVDAAVRARDARLLLLAADAADNTARRCARFAEVGQCLWLRIPESKYELGRALGRGSCAILAITDTGLALAVAQRLAEQDPVKYGEAAAKLAARWYGEPAGRMTVVGVTGTNGKTTTTYLLKQLLERCLGAKVGLIGTNQNMIGDAVLPAERTTPDALTLQRLLREMADAGCTHVVMEVSSHALVQRRAGAIDFALGVFTNLTQDHLDYHGTMEAYCDAKARLFRQCRAAAVNGDDPWTPRLLENVTCPVTRFGQGLANDLVGWDAHYCADRVSFTACSDSEHIPVTLHIPGAFSLYNALAALAAAQALGIPIEDAAQALSLCQGVRGRAEVVPTDTDYTVLIDYAHTPDGLKNILSTVCGFADARVLVVFGCGGDRDRTKRAEMGRIAARLADEVIVTSDNPRTENPYAILHEILAGMADSATPFAVLESRREAIAYALDHARTGDVVVLAGKGHETYQVVGAETLPLDERQVVREHLSQ